MTGLPSDLHRRLREVLLRCGPFDSNSSLRAVFVDGRIHAWRDTVPEAASRADRVDAVIDRLLDRTDSQGRPALALLVEVLADRVSPGDACHHSLAQVARKLRDAAELRPRPEPGDTSIDTGGGAYVGGNVDVGEGGVFVGRDLHGDVATGSKTTTFDQRGQQVQQQTNVDGDYHDRRSGSTYITHIEHATGVAIGDGAEGGSPPGQSCEAGSLSAATYLPVLRAHLQRLDDVALDALCMDYFPDVYDCFSRGMRRDEKANLLLDHCRRNAPEIEKLTGLLNA